MSKIKDFNLFLNENLKIDDIISELDKLGITYELSENKYKPFKVIYKQINKTDSFYKKFDDIIYLNNLESVVKNTYMENLKKFENVKNLDIKEKIKKEILIHYIKSFESEYDLEKWILKITNKSDIDRIDWNFVPYDIIDYSLDKDRVKDYLNVITYDEIREIIVEIMSEINLDNFYTERGISYEDWKIKNTARKFNL